MGEGEASITATWWGNSFSAREGAFLQARLGARVPTWTWGNAGRGECCRRWVGRR